MPVGESRSLDGGGLGIECDGPSGSVLTFRRDGGWVRKHFKFLDAGKNLRKSSPSFSFRCRNGGMFQAVRAGAKNELLSAW